MIGTTSSEISDQLRDRYSICKCCLNVATYINGKFTMGKLKSFPQSKSFVFDVCITPRLFSPCLATQLCATRMQIYPWNPCAVLQQNIPISRKQILAVYFKIIILELMYMYIVFVPFDWTRALSPVSRLFVLDSFITRWTFLHFWSVYNSMKFVCITSIIYKHYGDRRRETTIVSDWKQAWNQFNNKNREKIQIEEL